MLRVVLALVGVLLLAVTALALVWLLGQLLVGVGAFVVGTAGILSRLLWFLVFTGLLSGLVYFVASAWRPAPRAAAQKPAGGSGPVSATAATPTGTPATPVRLVEPAVVPVTPTPDA